MEMLTPQEVSEHAFTKASFGGYNMAMVDEFLDALTADYTALYKENAVLKSKMKVLVDKVEEYRTTEDAMRKALLTAQRMADEMVQEAERKRDEVLGRAEEEARQKIASLRGEIDEEARRLAVAKDHTADFMTRAKALCTRELEFLDKFGDMDMPAQTGPDHVVSAAQDIQASMEQLVQKAVEDTAPAAEDTWTVQEPAPQAAQAPVDLSEGYGQTDLSYGTEEASGGLYDDITFSIQSGKTAQGMEQEHFNITLGGPKPEPEPAPELEDTQPTRRIDFDHLQFGKDYEIK